MVNFVHRITAELLGLPLLAAIYRVAGLLRWPLTQVSLYFLLVMHVVLPCGYDRKPQRVFFQINSHYAIIGASLSEPHIVVRSIMVLWCLHAVCPCAVCVMSTLGTDGISNSTCLWFLHFLKKSCELPFP